MYFCIRDIYVLLIIFYGFDHFLIHCIT